MPVENQDNNQAIILSVARLLDAAASNSISYDTLITVLGLLCVFSILNKNTAVPIAKSSPSSSAANPLQKLLTEMTKTDGSGSGPSPDALMSLLPLLNNPQVKSKLNPTTISAILGLLGNLGQGHSDKEKDKTESKNDLPSPNKATTSQQAAQQEVSKADSQNAATQSPQPNSLNWKNSF